MGWITIKYSLRGIMGPYKFERRSVAFVTKGHGRVDDVLPVTADHHEPEERCITGFEPHLNFTMKRRGDGAGIDS